MTCYTDGKNKWNDCVSFIKNHGSQKTVEQVLKSPDREKKICQSRIL